jgi:hypothetical protein
VFAASQTMVLERGDEDRRMTDLAMRLGNDLGSRVRERCFTGGATHQHMAYNVRFYPGKAA